LIFKTEITIFNSGILEQFWFDQKREFGWFLVISVIGENGVSTGGSGVIRKFRKNARKAI
jgi:hypothetical protein